MCHRCRQWDPYDERLERVNDDSKAAEVHTFTARMRGTQDSRNLAPNVPTLDNVAISKTKPYGELVDYACNIFNLKVSVKWRSRGKGVSRMGGYKQAIRQVRSLVRCAVEDGKELKKVPCQLLSISIAEERRCQLGYPCNMTNGIASGFSEKRATKCIVYTLPSSSVMVQCNVRKN